MRMSDAIRLGSLITTPLAGVVHNNLMSSNLGEIYIADLRGCALGMAENALGKYESEIVPLSTMASFRCFLFRMWPWLEQITQLPCKCVIVNHGYEFHYSGVIAHLFDHHVMDMDQTCPPEKRWTLDQLCEWVASVEPPELALPPAPSEVVVAQPQVSLVNA